jgi:ribosomal protein S18 acetylase RimI-like enzyme
VAELFSEFNALLGADGVSEAEALLPEHVNVSPERMSLRLKSMDGVEVTLLAETVDGPAGLCCLRLVPYIGQDVPYAEVTQLYVRARFQRQGIGAELLRAAETRAGAAAATCVHIITGRTNLGAQAFYRAQGYRSDGVVFDKYFSREEAHA